MSKAKTTTDCPTCGRDDFETERAMKAHHTMAHGESIAVEESVCEGCGETFEYLPSVREGVWCSRECEVDTHRKSAVCGVCDEEFRYNPNESAGMYCSHACRNDSGRVTNPDGRDKVERVSVECFTCSETVQRRKSYLEKVEKTFCSTECRAEWVSQQPPSLNQVETEDGVVVDSTWEREIYHLLSQEGIEFDYCNRTFQLTNGSVYTPDFVVGDTVLEVKGGITDETIERAELFMEEYENLYVVVGNEIPCHIFIPWDEKESVLGVI